VRNEKWQIVGTFFQCNSNDDKVILSRDHKDFKWIDSKKDKEYKLTEGAKKAFRAYLDKK